MGTCQDFTKTKLHEDKFAQGYKIKQTQFCTEGHLYTRRKKKHKKK